MKNYILGQKIHKYKRSGSGKWTNYTSAINSEELEILKYAESKGFIKSANEAPRGGKWGEHFEVLKPFSDVEILSRIADERAKFDALNAKVLKSTKVDEFATISDIGSFVINGAAYSNFWGDGKNSVEICECDIDDFAKSEFLTRRQIYNTRAPISIVKFDAPTTLEVSHSDVHPRFGKTVINNAIGFVIWERKLKIFVCNKLEK